MKYRQLDLKEMSGVVCEYPGAAVCAQHSLAIFLDKPMELIVRKSILFSRKLSAEERANGTLNALFWGRTEYAPNCRAVATRIIRKYCPSARLVEEHLDISLEEFCKLHPNGTFRVVIKYNKNGVEKRHATVVANGTNIDWFDEGYARHLAMVGRVVYYYEKS